MGIGFDSTSMSWFLPKEKADRVIKRCLDVEEPALAGGMVTESTTTSQAKVFRALEERR